MQGDVLQATSLLEVAKVAIPALALCWAALLAYRKREWFTPTIALSVGEFGAGDFSNTPKSIRAKTIGSFLYLLDVPANGYAIVGVWFRVRAGRQPLRNVRLDLFFPEEQLVSEDRIARFTDADTIRTFMQASKAPAPPDLTQTVHAQGGVATVSYAIAILRPGEAFSVIQPLVLDLGALHIRGQTGTPPQESGATEPIEMPFPPTAFLRRLQFAPGFIDHANITAIARSESTAARKQRVDLYAFRHKASQDIGEALERLEIAMWNGPPPRAGELYFKPFPLSLFKTGVIQVLIPELRPVGKHLHAQEPYGKRQFSLSTLKIPPWDYINSDKVGSIGIRVRGAPKARRQHKRTTLRVKRED